MNDHTNTESQALALAEPQQLAEVQRGSVTGASLLLNQDAMTSLNLIAETMAKGGISVPQHFKGQVADCLMVCIQAAQWNMNPFAVAQKTHLVNGTLGYEAQLVNAVVQQSGLVDGRFHYEFAGQKGSYECRVGAKLKGDSDLTWGEWLNEKDVLVKNSPLWKTNVKQQLGYLQVKNWARLYTPGAILGVYTADEIVPVAAAANRNMGEVDQVKLEPTPELLALARAAASQGRDAFGAYWKGLTLRDRARLEDHVDALKELAVGTDKTKAEDAVVKQPTKAAKPAKATGAPTVTADSILIAMQAAKNEDELNEALAPYAAIENDSLRGELEKAYDRYLAALRGEGDAS